ncbi:MAG: hypothetical protein FWC92_07215 [Defluviitaleaceae bacterium]|nr:hypothetical protein [Defluviitaleaceae bacterium]
MFDSKLFDFLTDRKVWGVIFATLIVGFILLIAVIGITFIVTRIVTHPEPDSIPVLVETITDWNIFGVTISVGILTILSTVIAVWYTNKKTRELYEETRDEERKQNAMSLIKPSVRYSTFLDIREKLLLDGDDERMLLLSSKKDGFGFYDDESRENEMHCIFSICNEGNNRIEHINITTTTILTTDTEAEKPSDSTNSVKLLRKNERIFLRVHSDEQRQIRLNCIDKKEIVKTEFHCTINYLTIAGQQICYEYKIAITDMPKTDEKGKTTYKRKPEIINDEYLPVDVISIDKRVLASSFRDLQENLTFDGFGYRYRKIGDRQMTGTLDALHRFWKEQGMDTFVSNAATSVNNMNESMKDVASAVNEQREFFENFISGLRNQGNTKQIEEKESVDVINADETETQDQ